jgi:hypothetical protein
MTRIYIQSPGDPSVGILPDLATVQMDIDPERREMTREVLQEAFATIFDNVLTTVQFEEDRCGQ